MSDEAVTLPDGTEVVGVEVGVEVSTERWSEFTLDDGTVVRAKLSVASAIRLDDFDETGKPKYALKVGMNFHTVSSPEHLMRKEGKQ